MTIYISEKVLPYVYICTHKTTGHFYIGFRKANKVPSHIDLPKYKTSSKIVKPLFHEFHFEIIAEFFNAADAYIFESELISEYWGNPLLLNRRNHGKNLMSNKNTVVVRTVDGKCLKVSVLDPDYINGVYIPLNKGKIHTKETREKVSIASKQLQSSKEYRGRKSESMSKKYNDKNYVDYVQSCVDKYWESVKSDPDWEHHKPFLGKSHSNDTKHKQSISALRKPKFKCPICNKLISKHVLKKHLNFHKLSDDEISIHYENSILQPIHSIDQI